MKEVASSLLKVMKVMRSTSGRRLTSSLAKLGQGIGRMPRQENSEEDQSTMSKN